MTSSSADQPDTAACTCPLPSASEPPVVTDNCAYHAASDTAARPVNTTVWIIGPDDAPNAIEYEQSDGQVYLLCRISEADATGLGMFTSAAARSMGMTWRQSLESRRGR